MGSSQEQLGNKFRLEMGFRTWLNGPRFTAVFGSKDKIQFRPSPWVSPFPPSMSDTCSFFDLMLCLSLTMPEKAR